MRPCRHRSPLDQIALFVATAGGVGYAPVAPGTAGSLLALAVLWAVPFSPGQLGLTLAGIVGVGAWAAARTERVLGHKDPGPIVIDEVAGMFLSTLTVPRSFGLLVMAFLLFRFFDIAKPFPIRRAEVLSGGIGVMADDLIAGSYTLGILWGYLVLLGRFGWLPA